MIKLSFKLLHVSSQPNFITGSIFFLLVGHMDSEQLPSSYPFSPNLDRLLHNQPYLGQLAQNNRFISLGFVHNVQDLAFNPSQSQLLYAWFKGEQDKKDRMDDNNNWSQSRDQLNMQVTSNYIKNIILPVQNGHAVLFCTESQSTH